MNGQSDCRAERRCKINSNDDAPTTPATTPVPNVKGVLKLMLIELGFSLDVTDMVRLDLRGGNGNKINQEVWSNVHVAIHEYER
jgi:hypothetical protein